MELKVCPITTPIHTELLPGLGPLEYILNTPAHHRIHHGRNAYCIDVNYGV
jgi:alkylglycerol monooxygenase